MPWRAPCTLQHGDVPRAIPSSPPDTRSLRRRSYADRRRMYGSSRCSCSTCRACLPSACSPRCADAVPRAQCCAARAVLRHSVPRPCHKSCHLSVVFARWIIPALSRQALGATAALLTHRAADRAPGRATDCVEDTGPRRAGPSGGSLGHRVPDREDRRARRVQGTTVRAHPYTSGMVACSVDD